MAASRGWVLVFVLAVTTLIGCGDASQRSATSVLNGCRYTPSVSRAVSVECDYSGISSSASWLREGQLSSLIQEIRMSNAEDILITEDTFSSFHSLKSIHLNDIRTLRIAKNSWTQIARPEQVSITMERVSRLSLHSGAFSGWAAPGPRIFIRNVTRCSIGKSAFNSDSVIQSVLLQNIQNLTLKSRAFRADIGQLELGNVSLARMCQSGVFSGRIRNLSLRSVRISDVHSGCLQAGDGWDSLTVRSSFLGNIHPFGISGRVNDVVIEDSRLGTVDPQGLHLNTSTFTMNSTVVKELTTDALDVHFNRSVLLQTSSINYLRAKAFRRLVSLTGSGATLTIEQVSVGEAENGSLWLSEQVQVILLDIVLRDSCNCDVDKRALGLVVGDAPPRNATDEQSRFVRQIIDQVRCTAEAGTMTLAEFYCQNCSAQGEGTARCPPLVSLAVVGDWVWPIGIGTPLLVLVLVGAAAVLVKRQQGEEYSPADQLCSNRRTQVVTPEPVYSEISEYVQQEYMEMSPVYVQQEYSDIAENVQQEERHTYSAVPRQRPGSDHHHPFQPEPEYIVVDAPVLPRPPSSVSFEMTPRSVPGLSSQPVFLNCVVLCAGQNSSPCESCGAKRRQEAWTLGRR